MPKKSAVLEPDLAAESPGLEVKSRRDSAGSIKFSCSQSDLSAHLSLTSRAVSSRPSHPVLANILLDADEATQRVRLSAFDLSLGIQTSFPAMVEEGGKITLPAKLLSDYVARLPEGDITLESPDEGEDDVIGLITLTASSGHCKFRGLDASEFPELPVIDNDEVTSLSAESLIAGLRSSLFSASADETKQVLTGVHLTIQADGMEFAATDGHRLAVVQTVNAEAQLPHGRIPDSATPSDRLEALIDLGVQKVEGVETKELDVTIPAKALQELTKMLERQAGDAVAVQFDQSQAVFEWADQRLTTRLLKGQYPNYRQLIPRQFVRQVTVERRVFINALELIAVMADQKNNIVKLSLDGAKEQLSLSVDAQDVGSSKQTIPAQISGEDLDIAFNVKYLMDGLKALTTSDILLQMNTATSTAIITPLGGLQVTYLIMPVQIRGVG
jgi:DNA polymerase-3 subunit beta